jgi:hypothetical protein
VDEECYGIGNWADMRISHRYPLQIGNEWHYLIEEGGRKSEYLHHEIVGDTLINNQEFNILQVKRYKVVNNSYMSGEFFKHYIYVAIIDGILYEITRGEPYGSYDVGRDISGEYIINDNDVIGLSFGLYKNHNLFGGIIENVDYAEYVVNKKFVSRIVAGVGTVEFSGEGGYEMLLIYARTKCVEVGSPVDFGVANSIEYSGDNFVAEIYPNPVRQGYLNIETHYHIESFTIYDILGKVIYVSSENNNRIDISNWASGIYIVKLAEYSGNYSISKIHVIR